MSSRVFGSDHHRETAGRILSISVSRPARIASPPATYTTEIPASRPTVLAIGLSLAKMIARGIMQSGTIDRLSSNAIGIKMANKVIIDDFPSPQQCSSAAPH